VVESIIAASGKRLDQPHTVPNAIPLNAYLTETLETLNSEAQKAAETLEKCALMVNARKMESDFDRSDLVAKLHA
jgi:hypothetical protein